MDRPSMEVFRKTDRFWTCKIMQAFIIHWDVACPGNEDFFKNLVYVRADPNNDRMLAPGETLKKAFNQVIKDNNMTHFPMCKRWNLV